MENLILTEIQNGVGVITINSEKTLNSLSTPIIKQLHQTLKEWKNNNEVVCVFLQGAGERAFCAGGDVRRLHDAMKEQKSDECLDFFISEYQLDYAIHRYPKPIIVWGDRIVMGGGIGIMNGASHRIVTERSTLAMPEVTIGLYPDVGATWFLNRMPKGIGMFLGLTGARLNAVDALYLNLADYYVPSQKKEELLSALSKTQWQQESQQNLKLINNIFANIGSKEAPIKSPVLEHAKTLTQFKNVENVRDFQKIIHQLPNDPWIKSALEIFAKGSPTSWAVIIEQLNRGKDLSLEEVFNFELNLSMQFTLHPDFQEGVRALLVDKDQKPQWFSTDKIDNAWIEGHFTPLKLTKQMSLTEN